MVTYLSYFRNLPRVYLLDIETGIQEVVGDFPGMTFAPRFSPDGNKIIMSFAMDGNSDIYTMDLENRVVEKITNHPSIDTSPSYSPNGKYICFNSDRSGYQQIYVMKSNGSNVKRISFGKGIYGTPVWSPRGDLIAFTKMHKGKFYIGVMRIDGSGERLLTENFYQEAPSWSPNGRVLIFYRETKTNEKGEGFSAKLWSIDLTGYNERLVGTETDASDPKSPKTTVRVMEGDFSEKIIKESGLPISKHPAKDRRYMQGLWSGISRDPKTGTLEAVSPPYATGVALAK